jgi:hypothetical protein
VQPVAIGDGLAKQDFDREIVEGGKSHREVGTAHRFDEAVAVRRGSALAAEPVVVFEPLAATRVVLEVFFAAQQREVLWLDLRVPVALLPAVAAIALAAAVEVECDLECHTSAVAAAVLESWYPGARGGEAIASVLFGDVNPSGRLPITFPASYEQLPHPVLPGSDTVEPNFVGAGKAGQALDIDYDVEGADVGYRWFARKGVTPLFPFGFGLSYTRFEQGNLQVAAGKDLVASFTVRNAGERDGEQVAQLYLVSAAGERLTRLVGYQRVALRAGESRRVQLQIDRRMLAHWNDGNFVVKPGSYEFALGKSAADLADPVAVQIRATP